MLKGNRIILPSDVIKHILKHWYRVLIIAFVVTVVLIGYFYKSDKNKVAAQAEADAKAKYYDVNDFSEEELNKAQNAVDAYEVLVKTQNYYDNSYIQKVDPFAVKQTVLYYKIEMDSSKLPENMIGQEGNLAAALRPEYFYYVSRGDLGTDVATKLGVDAQYITELISVENDGNVCFNVIVRGTDQIPEFIDIVKTVLDEHVVELEKNNYAHKLVINNEFESVVRIDDYYNRQRNSISELNTCTNNLNYVLKQLDIEQIAYYNSQTGNEYKYVDPKTGEEEEVYVSIGTKGLIKKGIIGVVVGVAFASVVELFIFMYSRKIISESDYTISMGMVLIGSDKNDEDKKITTTKIKNACINHEIKRIVISCTEEELLKNNVVDDIKSDLEGAGMEVSVIADFINNSDKINSVLEVGSMVLVEEVGKSNFAKVNSIVEFCEDYNINLLGVVNCTAK